MDLRTEADLLRKVPMLSKLEPSKLKLLAFTSQSLHFDDGEIMMNVGDAADCTFVIMEGEVEILAQADDNDVVVGTLGRNELVGELGVLTSTPRSATIRCRGEVTALRITGEMFLRLLAENSEVSLDVMRQLSGKLARTHHQYELLQSELHRIRSASPEVPAG